MILRGNILKKLAVFALSLALGLGGLSEVEASAYRWPLDIDISQSSSFAEFRGMRFHAGIDLRTKQTNGFPVYAIEDGFISRASIQFTGYGYGLYIDHPKLNARVVYGHLKCFNGPIQEFMAGKLKAKGARHGVQEFFNADRFPVKKGQIVAYTGESGAGPSHLHFEMRTFNDEPVAPAKFGYRPKDDIFPTVYKFYVEPMEYGAVIDGSFLGKTYSLNKKSKALYQLETLPEVCGNVGLQLGISDTNGVGNKYGIETINLTVNGQKLIQRDFYKYSYDTNRQCPWVYDYFKSNMSGTGYVYNLFKWPFDTLPFAENYPAWSGVIGQNIFTNQEKVPFEIFASDYGNNSLTVNGRLGRISYDFNTPIDLAELNKYNYNKIVPMHFGTVVVGENPGFYVKTAPQAERALRSGFANCHDIQGNMHQVPCLYSGKQIELAFKNEPCWQNGAWVGKTQVLPQSVYIDSKGGTVNLEAGGSVEFKKNTVHFPVLATMKVVNQSPNAGGSAKEGFLKPYSPIWRFEPDGMVFDTEAVVKIRPNAYNGKIEKLGVYNVNSSGKYSHNGESVENGWLKFTTRSGGRYVILEDLIPPVLSYSRHFTHYQLGNVYGFKATDLGEGVAWLSAKATINGTKCETYADPDKKEVYVLIPKNLKKPHGVKLTVQDNCGNETTKSFNF